MGDQFADVMSGEGVRTYRKKPISLERQDQGRQYRDEDRPTKEGRVAVEVSVNLCREDFYLRTICAEIADSVFLLLARSSDSSMLYFPAPLPILACLVPSSLFRLC